jgi:hypothetical protein
MQAFGGESDSPLTVTPIIGAARSEHMLGQVHMCVLVFFFCHFFCSFLLFGFFGFSFVFLFLPASF